MLWQLVVTILLAIAGGYLGIRFKLPAGALIGSIISVGLFQLLTGLAYFPEFMRTFGAALCGTYLGTLIRREDLKKLRAVIIPAVIIFFCMMLYNYFSSFILVKTAKFTATDALFAMSPGGVTEMILASIDMGGDPAIVSIVQQLRLVIAIFSSTFVFKFINKIIPADAHAEKTDSTPITEHTSDASGKQHNKAKARKKTALTKKEKLNMLITLAIGISAGFLGDWVAVPAGAILVPMLAVCTFNVLTGRAYMPSVIRRCAQVGNGALIGLRYTMSSLMLVGYALPQILLLSVGWTFLNIIMALILYRFSSFSIPTAVFSTVPGGFGDMGLIAADYGGNIAQVSVLQLFRVVSSIAVYPMMIRHIVSVIG